MKRSDCLRLFLGAALITSLSMGQATQAEVIISEIMYNADGSDTGREWIEIYNTGSATVDIGGWDFKDEDDPGITDPIPGGTMINPGEALVLIEDQALFEADWGTGINLLVLPGVGTTLNLANSPVNPGNEVLMLRDASDVVIDTVDYDDNAPWPLDSPNETSIYVLPGKLTAADNDLGENWGGSVPGVHGAYLANGRIEGGSPGIVIAIPEPTSLVLLTLAAACLPRRRR